MQCASLGPVDTVKLYSWSTRCIYVRVYTQAQTHTEKDQRTVLISIYHYFRFK